MDKSNKTRARKISITKPFFIPEADSPLKLTEKSDFKDSQVR